MKTQQVLFKMNDRRASTTIEHDLAIERVILTMRERLNENLSLQDLAEIALLSPYYFNRVFHHITGIPPRLFLAALRLEKAKRLLLTTRLSITDVCFDVGYNSLGTFTTRFTQFVGVSPSRLRCLAEEAAAISCLEELRNYSLGPPWTHSFDDGLTGRVIISDPSFTGLIFVGIFSTLLPQGWPVACTLLTAPGPYHISPVPDGCYYLLATAFCWSEDPLAYLLTDNGLRGGMDQRPVLVRNGQVSDCANVILRPAQLTDPPILLSPPLLLAERLSASSMLAV